MTSEIKRIHDETERLLQQSLGANLLFVAYLLDIARLELQRRLAPTDEMQRDVRLREQDHAGPKLPLH